MNTYELRRSDGVNRTYLLATDDEARNHAAGITERGIHVEIWLAGQFVAATTGTLAVLPSGAFEFDQPSAPAGRPSR